MPNIDIDLEQLILLRVIRGRNPLSAVVSSCQQLSALLYKTGFLPYNIVPVHPGKSLVKKQLLEISGIFYDRF